MAGTAQSDKVPEKRSLKTKQKPNQTRIANLGIRLRLKVHFVFDKLSFQFIKTLYLSCKCNYIMLFNQLVCIYLPKKYDLHIFLNAHILIMVVILVLMEFHSFINPTVIDFMVVRTYF